MTHKTFGVNMPKLQPQKQLGVMLAVMYALFENYLAYRKAFDKFLPAWMDVNCGKNQAKSLGRVRKSRFSKRFKLADCKCYRIWYGCSWDDPRKISRPFSLNRQN